MNKKPSLSRNKIKYSPYTKKSVCIFKTIIYTTLVNIDIFKKQFEELAYLRGHVNGSSSHRNGRASRDDVQLYSLARNVGGGSLYHVGESCKTKDNLTSSPNELK